MALRGESGELHANNELTSKLSVPVALATSDMFPTAQVCSAHFVGGTKTDENSVPQLDLGYARKVNIRTIAIEYHLIHDKLMAWV